MKTRLVLFISLFILCSSFWRCNGDLIKSTTQIDYDEINSEDDNQNSQLSDLIEPYDKALSEEMNVVIGNLGEGMSKARPEGLLSNFVADLVSSEVHDMLNFNADMCLLNHGGLRAPLPQGDIKIKDIYELMPFENEVVILELTADKLQEMAIYLNYSGGEPISGATVKLGEQPEIQIFFKELEPDDTFFVITSDYLAKGGDKMNFFLNPVSYQKTGIKLRDMIINYFNKMTAANEGIYSELDGRISTK